MQWKYPIIVITAIAIALLAGCANVGYYSQIVSGHMQIVVGKKSAAAVADDKSVDESLRVTPPFTIPVAAM